MIYLAYYSLYHLIIQPTGVQTDFTMSSPSRARSKSVDDNITTPDLKNISPDESIKESEAETSNTSSPEAEIKMKADRHPDVSNTKDQHSVSAVNGKSPTHNYIYCYKCGSAISTDQ